MTNEKPFWQSKTFYFNGLTLLAGTLGYWAGHDMFQDQEQLLATIVALQSATNIVLRFMTTTGIK